MSTEEESKQNHVFEGKIREYEKQIIELFLEVGKSKGQTPIMSTILGYLLLHGSMTQKQLNDLTGFSIGSISSVLNAMIGFGFVEKRLIQGTHMFKYSFGGDLSQVASKTGMLKLSINEEASKFMQDRISELSKESNQNKKGHDILVERMGQMMNFLKIHRKILEIISKSLRIEGKTKVKMELS